MMLRLAKRSSLVPANAKGGKYSRYGFNPHEMRDVAATEWARAGGPKAVSDFFMGHVVDPLGYDKSPTIPEYSAEQFKKIEPYLSLIESTRQITEVQKAQAEEVQKLKAQIEELTNKLETAIHFSSYPDYSEEIMEKFGPYFMDDFSMMATDRERWIAFTKVVMEEKKKNPQLPFNELLKIIEKKGADKEFIKIWKERLETEKSRSKRKA